MFKLLGSSTNAGKLIYIYIYIIYNIYIYNIYIYVSELTIIIIII